MGGGQRASQCGGGGVCGTVGGHVEVGAVGAQHTRLSICQLSHGQWGASVRTCCKCTARSRGWFPCTPPAPGCPAGGWVGITKENAELSPSQRRSTGGRRARRQRAKGGQQKRSRRPAAVRSGACQQGKAAGQQGGERKGRGPAVPTMSQRAGLRSRAGWVEGGWGFGVQAMAGLGGLACAQRCKDTARPSADPPKEQRAQEARQHGAPGTGTGGGGMVASMGRQHPYINNPPPPAYTHSCLGTIN
jgi:hypothetical protein